MKSTEELLTRVMNRLAERFKDQSVVKGGMLLRLYSSPRSTQDIDFVLLTKESKKICKKILVEALNDLEDVKVGEVDLNSRGIFIDIEDGEGIQKAMVEINVLPSTQLPPEPLSTAPLAQKYSLSGRVISSMAMPEAFAHKIAATLERDAVRDLYDLSQMEAMGPFDQKTLEMRLAKLCIGRAKPLAVSNFKAAGMLRKKMEALEQKTIDKELNPFLPPEFRTGVLGVIRASVGRLIQRMEVGET